MVIKNIFDMDGDGDIDQFDEELTEYELQLLKDEVILKKRTEGNTRKQDRRRIGRNNVDMEC